uniref:Uncharacterized protein n=1 Tax=Monomastix sp. (strain OKE-1) TaxID=141716 RepID=U5YGL4_MONSK|nr:hypothetical protein [Monomastix sp. OKE-1]AGZ90216.1 hypothetical protein [Monomastix sp. OKE-1]
MKNTVIESLACSVASVSVFHTMKEEQSPVGAHKVSAHSIKDLLPLKALLLGAGIRLCFCGNFHVLSMSCSLDHALL